MKNIVVVALLFMLPFLASAQKTGERSAEIEALRISYLTQKLDLSEDEAKIFWPIYNEFQKEQSALRKERAQNMISFRKITEIDNLSDTEVQSLIVNELNFKQRDLAIEKKYYYKLKSSLPIKTVGKYYRAQETFKRELLSRYKNGRPERN
ncbi:hypothetical protein [Pedobacter gandavensis]|uniref:Sensor of ECF-type sigma factor n=1 Tax=Pedobacter gandavensis TaxID=2679963 RepID=A0ABR6EVU3_9SPHI|nr:hypothetical protein [Pedobacter gandavensis]MBB2149391.1 hypothetical protein [Pedobacter gandavensis]